MRVPHSILVFSLFLIGALLLLYGNPFSGSDLEEQPSRRMMQQAASPKEEVS